MRFEDFIAYLAACGVKRFTIEIDDSRLKETEIPEVREHIVHEFNGSLGMPRIAPEYIAARRKEPLRYAAPTADAPVEPMVPRGTDVSVTSQKVEEKATKVDETVKDEPKAEKPKAETAKDKPEQVKEKPAEKPKEKAQPVKTEQRKNAYDEFLSLVEKDDGSDLAVTLAPIAERLSLDEMLRINSEFGLVLDTDKPTEKIRADLIECW